MNENLELREWLAVSLMGWAKRNTASEHGPMFERAMSYPTPLTHLPAYESTYDGMGAVIERMREKGWMRYFVQRECSTNGHVARFEDANFLKPGVGRASTGPLAVALAAKDAIESETKS